MFEIEIILLLLLRILNVHVSFFVALLPNIKKLLKVFSTEILADFLVFWGVSTLVDISKSIALRG